MGQCRINDFCFFVCLAITERRWDSHVLPFVKRNPVRASSWGYSSHCCPDSCLVNDFAVFPGKSTMQQRPQPRVPLQARYGCSFMGAQSHSGTGLNWSMVCTLCMTPISHLYDLIVVKLMIFTDVDLDHLLFFGGKLPLSHKPLTPIQSS